ncbi:cytochrome-b5 reductase [Aureococcus anophagefferens]|nr:cytochrome-b5 reductase [Aureococcus anophagefferens]
MTGLCLDDTLVAAAAVQGRRRRDAVVAHPLFGRQGVRCPRRAAEARRRAAARAQTRAATRRVPYGPAPGPAAAARGPVGLGRRRDDGRRRRRRRGLRDGRRRRLRPPLSPSAARAALGGGLGPEWLKLRAGQVRATADALKLAWSDLFEDESLVVLEDTWAPCVLEATEDFGDDGAGGAAYTAYRFALKQGGKAVLPLELGQEVTFVGLDGRNRPVRASFPLASNRRDAGAVEVVVAAPGRRRAREAVGGLTAEQRAVVDAFDGLGIGGEAAVRPGRRAFTHEGSYLPITSLQCFAEELGALPVIQLKESLPRGRSTIAKAQVFWINEGEDDFGLYEGLETLFYKFPKKMELACVVDDKLHSPDTTKNAPGDAVFRRNDDLAGAVARGPGMLAVVAGPDAFQDQVVAHLTGAKGYPPAHRLL